MRTSSTHPLIIAKLPVGDRGGAIGVTFAPGKQQKNAMTGPWARDLDTDIAALRRWKASHLISLLEPWEFSELCIEGLPAAANAEGIKWHGMPITDGEAPDHRLLLRWPALSASLVRKMQSGQRVVVHCKGGLGRAGTVAAMLLLQSGTSRTAKDAIKVIRRVRPGAIETAAQEQFLTWWEEKLHRENFF